MGTGSLPMPTPYPSYPGPRPPGSPPSWSSNYMVPWYVIFQRQQAPTSPTDSLPGYSQVPPGYPPYQSYPPGGLVAPYTPYIEYSPPVRTYEPPRETILQPLGRGTPPAGLIQLEPGKWYDPRSRETWSNEGGQWTNLGVAPEIPKSVKVAPGMEVPYNMYMASRTYGIKTLPGVGFFAGGQFIRGKPDEWRWRPSQEELAFGQILMNLEGLDPRLRPTDPNPRTYFTDLDTYWKTVQRRGIPRTPREALDFWREYQWQKYKKDVEFTLAVGGDPSIYPPPDQWSEVLDKIGKPPQE